jgi:hypothetical protein
VPTSKAVWREALGVIGRLLLFVFGLFGVVFIVCKATWDPLVPRLFPGAVEQGLVAREISWWTAFSLAGAVCLVSLWIRWTSGAWHRTAARRIPVVEVKVNAIATHLGIDLDAAIKAEVAALSQAGKTADAWELYRSHTGASLAAAMAYVDGLK